MGRVFANGPGDRGSVSDRVIPKIFLKNSTSCLLAKHSTIRYGSRVSEVIEGKE